MTTRPAQDRIASHGRGGAGESQHHSLARSGTLIARRSVQGLLKLCAHRTRVAILRVFADTEKETLRLT